MMDTIRDLMRRIQEDPQDFEALVQLAGIYQQVEMWKQAIEFYEKALEINPDRAGLLSNLGMCYRGTGAYERALELFAQAYRTDPTYWQSQFNTAVVTGFSLGRFDRALEVVAALEEMDPRPPSLDELRQALEQGRAGAGSGSSSVTP